MQLRVILPIIGDTFIEQIRSEVGAWVSPGTEVAVVSIDRGPASIESEYDEALAGPGILRRVEEATADGVDAIFVSCGADPAIPAAREITDIPVVGGFEPAMLHALTLGEGAEALALDGRVMHEAILLAVVARDEAESLRVVEPLDGAGRTHCPTPTMCLSSEVRPCRT